MINIILCEGIDEVLILGYYLFKTGGWIYTKENKLKKLSLPNVDKKRQVIELYKKGEDIIIIWAVGGKDSFKQPYHFIKTTIDMHPEEGIERVFIVTDRDNFEIQDTLDKIKLELSSEGIEIEHIENVKENIYQYAIDDEPYRMSVIPIIVPFSCEGALETVLMQGIAEAGEQESYIVENAICYIEELLASGKIDKYLLHEREKLKAKMSAVVSVINPDRSTAFFDKMLMSWDWEKTEALETHFGIIKRLINET